MSSAEAVTINEAVLLDTVVNCEAISPEPDTEPVVIEVKAKERTAFKSAFDGNGINTFFQEPVTTYSELKLTSAKVTAEPVSVLIEALYGLIE